MAIRKLFAIKNLAGWKGDVDAEETQNGEKGGGSLNHFFCWSEKVVW